MGYLGDQFKKIRTAAGLKLNDIVDLTGISRTTLSAIEKGVRNANPEQVVKIAEAIDEPALMVARCRDCDIRNVGFAKFFPEFDLDSFADLKGVVDELEKRHKIIKKQITITDDLCQDTESFIEQFKELRKMIREYSYVANTASSVADFTLYLKTKISEKREK